MSSKKRHKKIDYQYNRLDILIQRDIPQIPLVPKGLYAVRVLMDGKQLVPTETGIMTFSDAFHCACVVKREIERKRKERFPISCIKAIKGVELLVDQDPTLAEFLSNGTIGPIDTIIHAQLPPGEKVTVSMKGEIINGRQRLHVNARGFGGVGHDNARC